MGCYCVEGQVALIHVGEEFTLFLGASYHGVKPPSEGQGWTAWREVQVNDQLDGVAGGTVTLIYICLGRVHTLLWALQNYASYGVVRAKLELKFVATATTCGRENSYQLCKFVKKTTHSLHILLIGITSTFTFFNFTHTQYDFFSETVVILHIEIDFNKKKGEITYIDASTQVHCE